jgi:uncharacterized repeat protein (TIGR01451 family)
VLKPGDKLTYTAQYTVKDTDICDYIVNNVTVKGFGPCSSLAKDNDTVTVRPIYNAKIRFEKASDKSREVVDTGDIITYTYYLENTGDVNFTIVSLVDDMIKPVGIEYVSGDDDGDGWLNRSEVWTYKGIYEVKEDDLCSKIVNWASLTAKDPCNKLKTWKAHAEVETTCLECCQDRFNVEGIDAGNQMSIGLHNGEAKNNVKIMTAQEGRD